MSPRLTLTLPRRAPVVVGARRAAERRSQECAAAATAHMDRLPPDADDFWHYLRRGRRRVYGGFLSFIDRARQIGTPFVWVLFAIDVVRAYAYEVYDAPLPTAPAARVTPTGTTLRVA